MKFIEVTTIATERKIHINVMLIAALEDHATEDNSVIHLMGGNYWHVKETVSEIQKKIEKTEGITFRYDTGPR
jgi:hypothetical protein